MVSTLTPDTYAESSQFIQTIRDHHFHFDGVALNRTVGYLKIEQTPGFEEAFTLLQALQIREREVLENLMKNPIPICATLPELARDVHSVEDLFHVAMAFDRDDSTIHKSKHGSPSH